ERKTYLLSAATLFSLLLSGCGDKATQAAPPPTVPVKIATVEQKTVPFDVRTIGNVVAYNNVEVRAQITAALVGVHFTEGQDVKEGQLLFTLDKRPLEADLEKAQANLVKDQAAALNARTQANRAEKLLQEGVMAHDQYDQLIAGAAAADATV